MTCLWWRPTVYGCKYLFPVGHWDLMWGDTGVCLLLPLCLSPSCLDVSLALCSQLIDLCETLITQKTLICIFGCCKHRKCASVAGKVSWFHSSCSCSSFWDSIWIQFMKFVWKNTKPLMHRLRLLYFILFYFILFYFILWPCSQKEKLTWNFKGPIVYQNFIFDSRLQQSSCTWLIILKTAKKTSLFSPLFTGSCDNAGF